MCASGCLFSPVDASFGAVIPFAAPDYAVWDDGPARGRDVRRFLRVAGELKQQVNHGFSSPIRG